MGSKVSHHAEVPQQIHHDKSRNADGNSRPDCDVTEVKEKVDVTSQTAQERVASWVMSCQRQENKIISTRNKKGELRIEHLKTFSLVFFI